MAAPAVATTALTGLEQFAWPAAWDHPQFPDTIFRTHTLTCKDIHGAPIRIAQHVSNYLLKRFLRQGCEIRLPTIPLTLVESEGMQSYCSEGANKDQWKECIPPHSQAEENARKISFGVLPVFQDASGEWLCVLQRSLPRQTDDDQALKCDPLRAHQQELSSLDSDLQPAKDAAARGAAEKTNYALVLKESDLESAQCVDKDPQAGAIYWVHVQGDTAAWLERDNPRSLQNLYAANKKKMIDHLEKEEPGDGQTNEERLRHIHKTVSLHIFRLKDLLVMIHEEAGE